MKKIIIITGHSPYQAYFVNTLDRFIRDSKTLSLEGVFLSGRRPYLGRLKKQFKGPTPVKGICRMLWNSVKDRVVKRLTYPHAKAYKQAVYNRMFGTQWQEIQTPNIFHEKHFLLSDWFSKIQDLDPDLILVHGGGIVPDPVIDLAKAHTFNLHWGISPIYRGSFCSPFCVLNNEIHNIGVTIHELSSAIDGGRIYANARPEIETGDTIMSVEMKLTILGTRLVSGLLKQVDAGGVPDSTPQDLSQGNMYFVKDYTMLKAVRLNRRMRQGVIDAYCQRLKTTD